MRKHWLASDVIGCRVGSILGVSDEPFQPLQRDVRLAAAVLGSG